MLDFLNGFSPDVVTAFAQAAGAIALCLGVIHLCGKFGVRVRREAVVSIARGFIQMVAVGITLAAAWKLACWLRNLAADDSCRGANRVKAAQGLRWRDPIIVLGYCNRSWRSSWSTRGRYSPERSGYLGPYPASTCCSVGDVHGNTDRRVSSGVDFARCGICRLLIEVGDGDHGPLAREGRGDLYSDSAGRASEDGNLIFQTHGNLL